MIGDSIYTVAGGCKYHQKCFFCVHCKEWLTSKYYIHNEETYCIPHYHLVSGTICYKCGKNIEKEVMGALGKKFHSDCFVCFGCNTRLEGSFYPKNNLPYCINCTSKLTSFPTPNDEVCSSCKQMVITGKIMSACGRDWHQDCFRCTDCRQSISSRFANVEGNPYCGKCAENYFK